jgi:chloramphenicol-sensitive protein RarD
MTTGIWYAVLAYLFWGFVPIYWKRLDDVPALQLICHRIVWSSLLLLVPVRLAGGWPALRASMGSRRTLAVYSAAAVTLAMNWLVYVWAVNAGFIVQTALGYFINPLVSVLLGVVVLRETLRRGQWIAIALAAFGVLYLTVQAGGPPLVALWLALSFGAYGLLKKTAPLGAIHGLAIESALLFLPALLYLLYADGTGQGAFVRAGAATSLLMTAAGPVTTIPLLLFAAGVTRIPLSVMGMLQYMTPTIQFLIGIYVYDEPFSGAQLVGFSCVWAALAVFALEGLTSRQMVAAERARQAELT